MGYASPQQNLKGFVPTDDVLQIDTTVYNITTTSYTTVFTATIIEDTELHSKLRFKATLQDTGGGGSAYARLYINGVQITNVHESGGAYVTHSSDFAFGGYRRGDLIEVKVSKSIGGTGNAKDISICGARSPVIYN